MKYKDIFSAAAGTLAAVLSKLFGGFDGTLGGLYKRNTLSGGFQKKPQIKIGCARIPRRI